MSGQDLKFAYSAFVYGEEPLDRSLERVARCGYDAIELMAYPERFGEADEIARQAAAAGIAVSSTCATAPADRDLVSPDPAVRAAALDHLRASAEFTAGVGAGLMVLAPTAAGKTERAASREEESAWAVEGLRQVGEHAAGLGVDLALECWNRYETYYLNRLEQAADLWLETGLVNGGVMADTFHMNIEEASIDGAILDLGRLLRHVHLADSNRAAPGTGHTEFGPVLAALAEVGYDGYLCFELLPPVADVFGAMRAGENVDFLDPYTASSIEFVRALAAESTGVTA
jgi:sugar phosphate isomerase/epimerase